MTQAAYVREHFGPKLAPSHKGGGRVWGTGPFRVAPARLDRVRSVHG